MSGVAYLEAKRTVDDRALDRTVLAAVAADLPESPTVLEVGAGTASMVERCYEWGLLETGEWIAVDADSTALAFGRRRLESRPDAVATADGVELGDLHVEFVAADAFEYARRAKPSDLLVGCAFFNLVALDRLSAFEGVADRVYAPITYDGTTSFEPADPEDEAVTAAYRKHMESCRPGTPDGGRELRAALSAVDRVGASPWEIRPPYLPEEARVVAAVLETIETAVSETGFDAGTWADRRRAQLAAEELRYRAVNVDVYGQL